MPWRRRRCSGTNAETGFHTEIRIAGYLVSGYPEPGSLFESVDAGLQAAIGGADDFVAILAAVRSAPDPAEPEIA